MTLYQQNQYRLGIMLAFGALLWNGTYNALAKSLTPYLSPIPLLLLSEGLTAAFIIITFGIVPLLQQLRKLDAHTIRMCVLIGLLNSAIAPLLFFTGLARTSAINASLLSSADIICILIAARFFLKENVSKMQMIGGGIVLTGVLVINLSSIGEGFSVRTGDFFIIAGATVAGSGAILYKKYLSHVMPELAILIRNIAAIVAVSIVGVFVQLSVAQEVSSFPLQQILLLLAFTFFSRYLNLTFYYESLTRLPASTLSLIQVGSPIAGIFFAALILGERVQSFQILGCVFIIFGLLFEQVSAQSLHSFRSLPFAWLHRSRMKTVEEKIAMIPRNV